MARYLFARELVEAQTVVDCACGDGTSSRLLADRAARVWAFDVSAEAIETARDAHDAVNIEFAVADAASLPLDDGVATAYVSLETIEHLPDDRAFLREVVRVLDKQRGFLVCSTPDREVYSPGDNPGAEPWNQFHSREYSSPEFMELLGRFFSSIELYGQNPKLRSTTRLKARLGPRGACQEPLWCGSTKP